MLRPTEKFNHQPSGQRRNGEAYCLLGELPLQGRPAPVSANVFQLLRGATPHCCSLQGTNTSCGRTSAWIEPGIPHSGVGSQNLVYVRSVVWGKNSALRVRGQELPWTFCVTSDKSLTMFNTAFTKIRQGPVKYRVTEVLSLLPSMGAASTLWRHQRHADSGFARALSPTWNALPTCSLILKLKLMSHLL